MQCERKPITKPTKDDTDESHIRGVGLSPSRHPIHPVHQEKQDFEPLTPTSPRSLSSPPRCPSVSSSVVCAADQPDSILNSENIQFKLNPPTLGISTSSMEYVYEIATRLLFLTVDWTRNIQAFRSLETSDQLVLLQSSWSDLFMLGVAQCSTSFPLSPLLTLAAVHMERCEASEDQKPNGMTKDSNLLDKMMSIKELLFSLEKLEMDLVEYAFLKTIVLFNPGNLICTVAVVMCNCFSIFLSLPPVPYRCKTGKHSWSGFYLGYLRGRSSSPPPPPQKKKERSISEKSSRRFKVSLHEVSIPCLRTLYDKEMD